MPSSTHRYIADALMAGGLDRHATYVALSRHRDHVDLHYGQDDFADQGRLVRTLGRERGKDMASDYTRAPAPAPAATPPAPGISANAAPPAPKRDLFAGIKLDIAPAIAPPGASPLDKAVGIVERGQAADRLWRDKLWYAAGGMIAGILLWSVLPGTIARSLPASWHVPEWMAARTMGMPPHDAGRALLRVDPAADKSR